MGLFGKKKTFQDLIDDYEYYDAKSNLLEQLKILQKMAEIAKDDSERRDVVRQMTRLEPYLTGAAIELWHKTRLSMKIG